MQFIYDITSVSATGPSGPGVTIVLDYVSYFLSVYLSYLSPVVVHFEAPHPPKLGPMLPHCHFLFVFLVLFV